MTTIETGLLDQLIEGNPPPNGRYGPYGGRFAPETLMSILFPSRRARH